MCSSINRDALKLVIVLSGISLLLQTDFQARAQTGNQTARKFDEFGDIYLSDKKARLDNFAIQLYNEPTTRGFVMVYRSRRDLPGLNHRYARVMRNYLVETRGISAERVVTVDGGVATCLMHELWIVPVGATPTPRSDAYQEPITDTDSARKFDEHYYGDSEEDGPWFGTLRDLSTQLEAFAAALQREPRSQAYIIAYAKYYIERGVDSSRGRDREYRRVYTDPPGIAWKVLKSEKAFLARTYHIAPSRIKVIDGGYRNQRQVELWIVPRGVPAPVPTPNQFPRRRRASSR
ncbi:MAG TPA: hypothetical protein VF708_01905 [Pyrinomonadaceae bacterium]|jgi:hypothetical protein